MPIIAKQIIKRLLPLPLLTAVSALKLRIPRKKIPGAGTYIAYVAGKDGIEIGGPSNLFDSRLPLYRWIQNLDGANFSQETIWEGSIREGKTFRWRRDKRGYQFIGDGTSLPNIQSESYEFVLSSNCLEHIANPLKALEEWKRILKTGGALIIVLPNKESNFDHRRSVTPYEHLVEDYNCDTTEHDLTHLDEILELHDLRLDPPAGDIEDFKRRSLDNFKNRTLHHHVFDLDTMGRMIEKLGLRCVQKTATKRDFYLLAVKD
jgi:SAM-dependent methyltransferase